MAYAGDSRFSDKGDMANLTAAEKVTFFIFRIRGIWKWNSLSYKELNR